MESGEIVRIMEIICGDHFEGVFAVDQLPIVLTKLPRVLIANTDLSSGQGKHWIAIYVSSERIGEYFDPLGQKPGEKFEEFLLRNSRAYVYNDKRIQNLGSRTCGEHSVLFCILRCLGVSYTSIVSLYSQDLLERNDIWAIDKVKQLMKSIRCK